MNLDTASREDLLEHIEVLEFELSEIKGVGLMQPWGINLRPREFEIMNCMAARSPHSVCRQGLLTALYPHSVDQPNIKIIDVWICRIRKTIEPLNLTVKTHWGRGYSLSPEDAELWQSWCNARTEGFNEPDDYPLNRRGIAA